MGNLINTEFIVRRMAEYEQIPLLLKNRLVHGVLRQVYGNVSRGEDIRFEGSRPGRCKVLFKVYKRDFDVRRANGKSVAKQARRTAERRGRQLRLTLKKELRTWPKT